MANAKVAITAENKMSKGLLQSKKDMMKFQQSVQKIGSTLKTAFAVTSVTVGLKKLGDAFASAFKDFNEAERKYKQLRITLGDGSAYDSVTKNIQKLSKLTLSSKDDIESMVSELAGLGKSADEVNMISDAAVALSNVTGKDLNTSMTALLNTFSGTTTTLKKMGLDVSDLTKDELANGAAVQLVIDKYYDLSKAMAEDDSTQHIQNMKNNLGDMKQVVGDFVNFTITPLLADLDVFTENLLTNLNNFVQNLKVVISNFPEIMSRLGKALGEAMSNLFSIDGIKNLIEGVYRNIILKLQLVGNAVANLAEGVHGVLSLAIEGVGNYAMYWITGVADRMGIDISEVINSIGKWLLESPVGQVVDNVVTTAVNGIRLVGALIKNVPEMIKLVCTNAGTIISNLWTTIKNSFFSTIKALSDNLAQTLDRINFPQLFENLKVNVSNFFGRIGAWFSAVGDIAKDTFRYIGDILKATFSWDSIKTMFTTLFKNIGIIASTTFNTIFQTIPSMISSLFEGIGKWIAYMAVHLKNTLLEAIQGFINSAGEKLQGTWFGKVFGLGDKLASVDLNIDRSGENNLKAAASDSFSNIGSGFQKAITNAIDAAHTIAENNQAVSDLYANIEGIAAFNPQYEELAAEIKDSGAIVDLLNNVSDTLGDKIVDNSQEWKDIGKQFSALLNPVFEKFTAENSETIGQTMAKWTAKSSDEYYEAAKKNFKDIGSFLKDWGQTFLGDLSTDWDAVAESVKTSFGDVFGDSFEDFVDWFKPFIYERLPKPSGTSTGSNSSGSSGSGSGGDDDEKVKTFLDNAAAAVGKWTSDKFGFTSDQGSAFGSNIISNVTASLGTAGELMSELATNMATMGPILGAIATALKYVLEGFSETLGPMLEDFVQGGLEPLRELGRVIGDILLPIFDVLMPLVEESMTSLMGLFDTIGVVLKPLISFISSALIPVIAVLTVSLKVMEPVIKILGKALVTVTGTFEYIGQALRHWVATLLNWLASINLMGWKPFEGLHTSDPGAPGDFLKYINNKYSQVDAAYATTAAATTSGTSVSTAVSSAGYQGATHVTINIYQQAPVVGDNGMRAFASMIRDEFEALDYYGVGA